MSDILIRGIELPTAEEKVRLILITRTGRAIDMLCEEYEVIPDHGRLIDADALEQDVQSRLQICNKYDNQFQKPYEVMRAIALAPTVIPANTPKE